IMDKRMELSLIIAHIIQQAKECLQRPEIKLESLRGRNFLKASGKRVKAKQNVFVGICHGLDID
uniref:Uncharacterized protein n=1 Tax=Salmo trutta TaxID=8032 RepID=A0A673W8M8_SALTR